MSSSSNCSSSAADCHGQEEGASEAAAAAVETNKDAMGGNKTAEKEAKKEKKKGRACKHFKEFGADEAYKKGYCTDPHFVCGKCGRCAQRSDQLCRPEQIASSSTATAVPKK